MIANNLVKLLKKRSRSLTRALKILAPVFLVTYLFAYSPSAPQCELKSFALTTKHRDHKRMKGTEFILGIVAIVILLMAFVMLLNIFVIDSILFTFMKDVIFDFVTLSCLFGFYYRYRFDAAVRKRYLVRQSLTPLILGAFAIALDKVLIHGSLRQGGYLYPLSQTFLVIAVLIAVWYRTFDLQKETSKSLISLFVRSKRWPFLVFGLILIAFLNMRLVGQSSFSSQVDAIVVCLSCLLVMGYCHMIIDVANDKNPS